MKSLRDQLLTAGLTDNKSVKDVRKQKQRQNRKFRKTGSEAPEIARQAEQAQRDKSNRDKELKRLRQVEAEKKAHLAQIRQLIDTSKIERTEGEVVFHFTIHGRIKNIHVTTEQREQLARNQIAIAIAGADQVELVPRVVAEKIALRDSSRIIQNRTEEPITSMEDDPYADYKIPDDLIW